MSFEKLPAVEGSVACFTCGAGARSDLHMEHRIAVGFGSAGYQKDGVTLWQDDMVDSYEDARTVQDVEDMAKQDPDHDWRIFFFAPLYEAIYQRQDEIIFPS